MRALQTPAASPARPLVADSRALRTLADQAFSRAAGAPLIPGNRVRLLKDAQENYPAWLHAIEAAEQWIHFENYMIAHDVVGREFAEALARKARAGVRVRILYDWLGTPKWSWRRFWGPLLEAGAEVRCFNPPRFDSPAAWLTRDHRKMVSVDGRVGFVSGLCVNERWRGNPKRRQEPWRDTGVEVRGPAVAQIDEAFAEVWRTTGAPLPRDEAPSCERVEAAGDVALRVIAAAPATAGLYRLDHLIAAVARKRLWLTDAYFVGVATYVQALRAAAADGVDVRLLVPGASDIAVLKPLTRAGYRPLLEAGIRVFEWNGSMLHAKTAVADGRWARVGSSNLNLASWIGNYELDVAIEDEGVARTLEQVYGDDLARATEIVLSRRRRVRPAAEPPPSPVPIKGRRGRSERATAGALRVAYSVGAAVGNRRVLGPAEARVMALGGGILLALAAGAVLWPLLIAVPLAVAAGWASLTLLLKAWRLWRQGRRSTQPPVALRSSRSSPGRRLGKRRSRDWPSETPQEGSLENPGNPGFR